MKYLILILTLLFAAGCDFEPLHFEKVNNYRAQNSKTEATYDTNSSKSESNATINKSDTKKTEDTKSQKSSKEKEDNNSNSNANANSKENGSNNSVKNSKKEKILIIDNDVYDPDYIPLVLSAMHENRWGYTKVGLMIVSDIGVSGKTNMLYRSILEKFDSNIPLAITHKQEGVVFRSKLTNNLESYIDIIADSDTEDAIIALQNKLEEKNDKTVTYATGGKLKFLRDFIADPYREELFKLKVKEIIFGLGCNPRDMQCKRDHNLASTKAALNSTKTVYSKLHGKIPFVVVDDRRGDIKRVRALDIFKTSHIPIMNHLLGTNIYGTYGDHHVGDLEILLANSRREHFNEYKCTVKFTNESFKALGVGRGGDILLINKDININGISKAMYSSLIEHLD